MSDSYSLRDFGQMIADVPRFSAYSAAIAKAVRPGDVVLEIGCGPGIFAMLARRAGARRVFAVETDDIIDLARQLAAANGFADRIEFFQCDSRKLTLPEQANIIISDIRGALPLYNQAVASLEDARSRLLAPGGVMIPQRDILKAALIEAPDFYSQLAAPWQHAVPSLDLSRSLPLILNDFTSSHFAPEQLLTESQTFGVLDYTTNSSATSRANADLTFTATRSATAHGICAWFDATLLDEIGFSSAPGAPNSVYAQVFFPWLQPVPLQQGQEVRVRLRADLIGASYVWQWETSIPASAGREAVHFRQSTFHSNRVSPRFLRTHALDFVPRLSDQGQADLWLLQTMDGQTPLHQIAQSASRRFPDLFPTSDQALHHAANLAEKSST
jgi:protein arginine N-methyltransferase 1